MEENEKKLSKVGIVSCSGEDFPEGTISRLATLEALHHKKPFDTTTICLPLFIAGGEGDRMFAKNHPVITVDGCEKLCAKRATEKYSGKVACSINVRDFIKDSDEIKNKSNLNEDEKRIASEVTDAISLKVDDILKKNNK
ncbi:MAG: putative zinc-binding protein [Actinobacteria bacterium]|nr:putative zinc-binding protein [Actinomycetota bacterium]